MSIPNWCQNKLNISGSKKDLARFARENKSRGRSLSFEKLLPTPDALSETVSPRKRSEDSTEDMRLYMLELSGQAAPTDWHTWRVQKWGTKWNVGEVARFERTEGGVLYDFDTAWSPPLPWVEAAAKAYPALSFDLKYYENGNNFSGQVIYGAGNLISQKEGTGQEIHPEDGFEDAF